MLKGKAAVVTGSTSGIGLGIAQALAEAGCNIMLNGFGEAQAIERERTQIANDFGVGAAFHPADLSKPADIARMIETATREFGAVDILVNNAGIQHTAPIENFPVERWMQSLQSIYQQIFRQPRCYSANASPQLGPHHQYRLDARSSGFDRKGGLRRRETRSPRADKSRGARNGHHEYNVQRDLPGMGLNSPGRKANQGTRFSRKYFGRSGKERSAVRKTTIS